MRNNLPPLSLLLTIGILLSASGGALAATPQAEGGSNQRVSVEGCVNQWLFDGIWRVRITDVAPDGTSAMLHVRNGYHESLSTWESGFAKINGQGIEMAYSDDTTQPLDLNATGDSFRPQLSTKTLPPGAAATTKLIFAPQSNSTARPAKLLIAVDPTYNTAIHYSVKQPSFRIHLDCTK